MAMSMPSHSSHPPPLRLGQGSLPLGQRGVGVGPPGSRAWAARPSRSWGQVVNRGGRLPAEAEGSEQEPAQELPAQEAEAEQPAEDLTPLDSWAENVPGDKWEAGRQQLAKNTYVFFAAGIAAVAVLAGWLAWQYGAVRQSRLASAAATVSVSTPAAQPSGQEDEGDLFPTLQAPRTASGIAGGSQEGNNVGPAAEARAGQAHESHVAQHPDEQQQQAAAATGEEQPEPAHGYKRPMCTPEGEAVLARIRAAQEERKAQQQRGHKPAPAGGNGGAASSPSAAALGAAAGKAEGLAEEESKGSSASQAAGVEGSGEESTPGDVAIPEGMDLDAMRRRAGEASKASTASAAAAHSAATASALAADASQAAAHYAQQAAAAATRAQAALGMKAADAIEAAYGQAAEAEKHASAAAAASTSQAVRATKAEKKAAQQGRRAMQAADLSSAHSVVEKAAAAARQSRRAVVQAATTAAGTATSACQLVRKEVLGTYAAAKSFSSRVASQLHRLWADLCQLWARASAGGRALFQQARGGLGAKQS